MPCRATVPLRVWNRLIGFQCRKTVVVLAVGWFLSKSVICSRASSFATTLADGESAILNPHCIRQEEEIDTSRSSIVVLYTTQRKYNSVEGTSSEISKISASRIMPCIAFTTQRFLTVFTQRARYLSHSWARIIRFTFFHPIYFIFIYFFNFLI